MSELFNSLGAPDLSYLIHEETEMSIKLEKYRRQLIALVLLALLAATAPLAAPAFAGDCETSGLTTGDC